MAKRVTVALVDDLDGTTADETVEFSVQREQYEIDLSAANIEKLNNALQPFVSAGRLVGKAKKKLAPTPQTSAKTLELQKIRDWCNANGFAVHGRGRIPQVAQQAYDKAHYKAVA